MSKSVHTIRILNPKNETVHCIQLLYTFSRAMSLGIPASVLQELMQTHTLQSGTTGCCQL